MSQLPTRQRTITAGRSLPPVTMPQQPGEAPAGTVPEQLPEDWPFAGYTGPQPWEVLDPPKITHDRGFVASGAAGDAVVELAACLSRLGFETALSQGQNPHAIYGTSERAAVAAFCAAYGVEEDPAIVRATTAGTVGVWIWEALFRAIRNADAAGEEA